MQNKQPGNHNPYAQAAGAYGDHAQKHTPDQRELEARVLLKSAKMLQDLKNDWANAHFEIIESTLKYNRQIWMMFYDTAVENKEGEERPDDLRSNIINLANFIFKREMEILSDKDRIQHPQRLDSLININREIAAGLMSTPSKAE
ncbi:MAG: flagellar biosynthesis regulator FlaF [Alphaproteobacteria bacterium]|nr:flagellar biosynthesis regulator FlaF [Alphaproteobacteria bacterium]